MRAPTSILPVLRFGLGIALPLAWLTGCLQTNTQPLIAVRAVAVAASAPATAPQSARTFVFAKGRNVGSSRELDKVNFDVIARPLVVDLKAANLEPAAEVTSADLVILVNWGRTAVAAEAGSTMMYDLDDLRRADTAVDDARTEAQAALQSGNLAEQMRARGMVAQAEADRRHELLSAQAALSMDLPSSDTADLLGIRDLLAKSEFSPNSATIRGLLDDERYFVGLVAYDGRELRRQTKRVVWTTRMSIPARGMSFADAVAKMSAAAAPITGTAQPDIVIKPAMPRAEALPAVKYTVIDPTI